MATRGGFERDGRGATLAGVFKEGLSEEMTVKQIGQESAVEMSRERVFWPNGTKNGQSREEHKLGVAKEQKEHIEADDEEEGVSPDTAIRSGLELLKVFLKQFCLHAFQ